MDGLWVLGISEELMVICGNRKEDNRSTTHACHMYLNPRPVGLAGQRKGQDPILTTMN